MYEIRKLAPLIDFFTRAHDRFRQRSRSAAKYADLAHVTVLLLHKLQEGRHVRSSEMIHRLQSSEHTPLRDSLKVILANVQHRGSQIKLVEELRDKDVHLKHISDIFSLNIAKHIDEPFEMAVARAGPEEVHFLTCNS